MDIKVDIDANEVSKHIAQTVLQSTIGDVIKRGIEKQLKDLAERDYNNPIQSCIREIIAEVIKSEVMLHEKKIRSIVSENITEKHVKGVIAKIEQLIQKGY